MRNSAIARLAVMGALTIGLLIPLMWVHSTVSERASRRQGAVAEVGATWGGPQTIGGPVLSVPYFGIAVEGQTLQERAIHRAYFLPRNLRIEGALHTETRSRGIFDVPVYRSTLKVTGTFVRPDLQWIRPVPERIDWNDAMLHVGVADPRGLVRRATLDWGDQTIPFTGGTDAVGLFRAGLRAPIPEVESRPAGAELPFSFTIEVNGTRDLWFLPASEETAVALTSTWPHPSFLGAALPESRRVDGNGFTASWRVQDFGRPYAARWTSASMQTGQQADASAFGVSLVQPVDIYQQAERAVKYAVLFIVLTFLIFFLWEVFSATLLHPVQYAFVGFAMCVFYMLLVSISEHTGFDTAYALSSAVTIVLIAGYARAVLGGLREGASVLAALVTLYGFLYLLLRLEDYALLAGSVGLFVVLAFVMFVTRRMNWYELKLGASATSDETSA